MAKNEQSEVEKELEILKAQNKAFVDHMEDRTKLESEGYFRQQLLIQQERQAEALERIANALEKNNDKKK